jgi:hypothetical protein
MKTLKKEEIQPGLETHFVHTLSIRGEDRRKSARNQILGSAYTQTLMAPAICCSVWFILGTVCVCVASVGPTDLLAMTAADDLAGPQQSIHAVKAILGAWSGHVVHLG